MCSVFHYFVYVFHLIKFVSFYCYRIFLVNKEIEKYPVVFREIRFSLPLKQIRAKVTFRFSPTILQAY